MQTGTSAFQLDRSEHPCETRIPEACSLYPKRIPIRSLYTPLRDSDPGCVHKVTLTPALYHPLHTLAQALLVQFFGLRGMQVNGEAVQEAAEKVLGGCVLHLCLRRCNLWRPALAAPQSAHCVASSECTLHNAQRYMDPSVLPCLASAIAWICVCSGVCAGNWRRHLDTGYSSESCNCEYLQNCTAISSPKCCGVGQVPLRLAKPGSAKPSSQALQPIAAHMSVPAGDSKPHGHRVCGL